MCLLLPGTAFAQAPAVSGISPSAGPTSGGTTVTITGTNLTSATVVDFGATAATGVTVNSATSITATAPAHAAGTVDVTVTTAGGTSAVSGNDQYTYVTPVVAGPVSATVAYDSSGNGITLNLSGGAPTSVAVATAAAHGTATASGTTITYTPTTGFFGPDSFTYTATNGASTSAPATVSITVSAPTIAVSPASLTAGTFGAAYSQSLTATGGQAPYILRWRAERCRAA
jgi:large repetitive protein